MPAKKKKEPELSVEFNSDSKENKVKTPKKRDKIVKNKVKETFDGIKQEYDPTTSILETDTLQMNVDETDFEMAMALQTISPAEMKKKADGLLKRRRRQIRTMIDARKLEEGLKIADGMEAASDFLASPDVWRKVMSKEDIEAKDIKLIAESYLIMAKALQNITRLDSIDGVGTPKRLNIGVQYKGADGSETSVIVRQED